MDSNLYKKEDILRVLSRDGHFMDMNALEAFIKKWKIEAIFENDTGEEFFDENIIDLITSSLFINESQPTELPFEKFKPVEDLSQAPTATPNPSFVQFEPPPTPEPTQEPERKKVSILAGALEATGQTQLAEKLKSTMDGKVLDEVPEATQAPEEDDFDDISLLSESFEAQEKFKEYVLSEMAKKNMDITPPQGNEFKLDISEKTINMIARTLAKKIVKNVNALFSQDMVSSDKVNAIKEQNKKLEKRTKELEEQNRKLRLLLAESNKNLNSYKPSLFGLYKKVTPKQ